MPALIPNRISTQTVPSIRDTREMVSELLAENARLTELDREKTASISHTVHDLRGSLTSMNLQLYMLEHTKPEQQSKYLAELKESIAELAHMAEELLAQARQNSNKQQPQ